MKELLYIEAISLVTLIALGRLLPTDLKPLLSKREFAAAMILPAVSTISPNYLVFSILLIAFIAFIPASHEQRVRLALFSLPLLPLFSVYVKAPSPINQLVRVDSGILLLLGCIPAAFALSRRARVRFGMWDVMALLLMTLFLFMAARGSSVTNILREAVQALLAVGLPYFLISRSIAAAKRPSDLLLSFGFAAAVVATITIFESTRHWLLYSAMDVGQDPSMAVSAYANERGGLLRPNATFPEPTSLSLFLALASIILFALRWHVKRRGARRLLYVVLGAAVFFTFARIGPLVLIFGIVGVLFFERRYEAATALIVASPLAWMALKVVSHIVPILGVALGMGEDAAATADYRRTLMDGMMQVIREHPLVGVAPDRIPYLLADLKQGQGIIDLVNAPLAVALEAGVIGLIIFLIPTIVSMGTMLRGPRRDTECRSPAAATFAGLLGLNVGLCTTSLGARNALWLMLLFAYGAGIAAKHVARNSVRPIVKATSSAASVEAHAR